MRFSSAFQPRPQTQREAREGPAREGPKPQAAAAGEAAAARELPDDLDARVRLVGEWQLGEA
jgi:hypothetical protein